MKYRMNDKIIFLLMIIILTFLDVYVFYLLKNYQSTNKISYYLIAVVIYAIIAYLLSRTFAFSNVAVINAIWNAMSVIFVFILGLVVFKQSINSKDIIGIVLIVIGIIVIGYD